MRGAVGRKSIQVRLVKEGPETGGSDSGVVWRGPDTVVEDRPEEPVVDRGRRSHEVGS